MEARGGKESGLSDSTLETISGQVGFLPFTAVPAHDSSVTWEPVYDWQRPGSYLIDLTL